MKQDVTEGAHVRAAIDAQTGMRVRERKAGAFLFGEPFGCALLQKFGIHRDAEEWQRIGPLHWKSRRAIRHIFDEEDRRKVVREHTPVQWRQNIKCLFHDSLLARREYVWFWICQSFDPVVA